MSEKKIVILRNTFLFSASNYIAIFIGFFVSVLSKRILGIEGTGQWATLMIFLSYGLIVGNFGIEIAITREIPQAKGRGEHQEVDEMINVGFTSSIIIGVAISLVYILVGRFWIKDPIIANGLLVTTALFVITLLYNLNLSILRAKKFISALSKITVINVILVGFFSLLLAYFYGVIGYLIGTILSTLCSFFISSRIGLMQYKWCLNVKKTVKLIIIGLPMLIAGLIQNTFLGLDKIIIASMLGVPALGLYSIALMATQQLTSLPRFFQTVLFPYVQEDYGRSRSLDELRPYFIKAMYIMSRLLPFVIGLVIFFIPAIVIYFLPKFKDGLFAMQVLVCGFYFVILSETNTMFIYTINKQRILPLIYAILLAISAGLNYFVVTHGWGIAGVALASSIAYLILFMVESAYAYLHIMKMKEFIIYLSKLIAVYICVLLIIFFLNAVVVAENVLLQLILRTLLFCLFYSIILIRLEKKEALFSLFRRALSGYFKKEAIKRI